MSNWKVTINLYFVRTNEERTVKQEPNPSKNELDSYMREGLRYKTYLGDMYMYGEYGDMPTHITYKSGGILTFQIEKKPLFATKKTLSKPESKLIFDPELAQSQFILKNIKKYVSYNGFIHSGNLEVVAKLASQHLGYALLPTKVANQYPTLQAIESAPSFKDRLCLVYRKEKHQNEISQEIIKLVRDIK